MQKKVLIIVLLLTITVLLSASTFAGHTGTTHTVTILASGFDPASVTVGPYDTVLWRNNDSRNHIVTADTGEFGSGILLPGATYSYTFNNGNGVYRYSDSLSSAQGTINVGLFNHVFLPLVLR